MVFWMWEGVRYDKETFGSMRNYIKYQVALGEVKQNMAIEFMRLGVFI